MSHLLQQTPIFHPTFSNRHPLPLRKPFKIKPLPSPARFCFGAFPASTMQGLQISPEPLLLIPACRIHSAVWIYEWKLWDGDWRRGGLQAKGGAGGCRVSERNSRAVCVDKYCFGWPHAPACDPCGHLFFLIRPVSQWSDLCPPPSWSQGVRGAGEQRFRQSANNQRRCHCAEGLGGVLIFLCVLRTIRARHVNWMAGRAKKNLLPLTFPSASLVVVHSDFDPEPCSLSGLRLPKLPFADNK